jgi:magnesium transporter
MIEIIKTTNGVAKQLKKPEKGCWINLVSPSKNEMLWLNKIIDIPKNVITSVKDKDEVSTLEKYGDTVFVLIRIPARSSDGLGYKTVPMGILRTDRYMITISCFENEVISEFKEKLVKTTQKREFGLNVLLASTEIYMKYLKEISKKIYTLRQELQSSMNNSGLMKLLDMEKSLVYFNTSLESNKNLVERMERDALFKKKHSRLLDDVMEEYSQAIEMSRIYMDILTGTMNGFSSVISNNLNMTMRFLTSITIILMLPTLISSIYGMNVHLPLENDPNAFAIILIGSVLLAVLGIIFFWKRDMF